MKSSLTYLCALIATASAAHAATVLPISEVYTHNEYSNATQGEDDMINGSGMNSNPETGNVNWPSVGGDPSTWTATSFTYNCEWQGGKLLSGATNSKIGWAVFDLGSSTANLEKLYLWHIRENAGRVAATFNIYLATSPVTALSHGPDNQTSAIDYDFASGGWTLATAGTGTFRGSSSISLGNATARYIGIEILTNGGDAGRVGFAEVAITQIPEPSIALLGSLGLICLLRRRKR